MAMRTLKKHGKPLLPRNAPENTERESRGPETCPSLERDVDPNGRVRSERGKNFDDGVAR